MTSWLASQTDVLSCGDGRQIAFSIPGDGFARQGSMSGRPTASGDWELEGEIAYAEGRMIDVAAVVVGMKVADQPALLLVPVPQRGTVLKEQVMLDPSRPGITVLLGGSAPARGRCIFASEKAEAAAAALRSLSRTLVAAEMLGIATMVLELAVRYARSRFQFGKPLCEFQAVSHACADMLCDVELTRSLLYGVGKRPTPAGVPTSADAAKAKFLAGELCPRVVDRAVHVFGAEGLTWDRGLHFAVRRIQALRALWGDPLACEAELAAEIGL